MLRAGRALAGLSMEDLAARPEIELLREFEITRPRMLGALLDAWCTASAGWVAFTLTGFRAWRISPWAAACEPALWPAGTFARAYAANRRAAIESVIEADPIATCVRAIMVDRTTWSGSASELLRLCAESARDDISRPTAWAKNPRALAGRLRRAQTFLRRLGIEITFSHEGRTGTRMIKVSASGSTVSAARSNGSRGDQAILAEIRE